jgi:UDP-N-acetylglucosamine--N-acetylmuramyl-(pentapeptide) pyrophosphoryl-undecaprenol N-acetylglucosamine transferase
LLDIVATAPVEPFNNSKTMSNEIPIVFAGGGTAGHLMPGLAVAEQLRAELRRVRVIFAGGGKPLERRLVADAGFEYCAVPCRALPRGPREAVPFLVQNVAGYLAARRWIKEECIAAVVGLGGYASVPLGRAALHSRIPLILLEQNVLPGRATRWLARGASLVCTSFAETADYLTSPGTVRLTGNPIRKRGQNYFSDGGQASGRENSSDPFSRRSRLLVLGGSGGARTLNENVPRALYKCGPQLADWEIIHQTGEGDATATAALYEKLALRATVAPFFDDVPELLATADLAVCRAGGTTLAELAAAGVPTVLLPYPRAKDDHQRKNGDALVAAGGAVLLDERELTGRLDDHLAETISALAGDAPRRTAMAAAMRDFAHPEAAGDVAALVWSVIASCSQQRPAVAAAV